MYPGRGGANRQGGGSVVDAEPILEFRLAVEGGVGVIADDERHCADFRQRGKKERPRFRRARDVRHAEQLAPGAKAERVAGDDRPIAGDAGMADAERAAAFAGDADGLPTGEVDRQTGSDAEKGIRFEAVAIDPDGAGRGR